MEAPLLRVEGLQTHFASELGTIKAVDGVTFDVPRGGVLGMVGESGSGKSVTGLSILRLLGSRNATIAGGRILFKGEDLLQKSEAEMRQIRGGSISMVFQNAMTSLDPFFRIGDQLAEVIKLHQGLRGKAARDRALHALELVRIPDPVAKLKSYPHQLSGGQRQRVVIALALACEPDLLIADEPTTALDATVQKQIIDLLLDINRELGTAIVMITHDMGVVAHMCQTVAVMYAGRIVEHGAVEDVLRSPEHPYTRGLMASVPRLHTEASAAGRTRQRLYQIGGSAPLPLRLTDGCAFAPRCPEVGPECWTVDPPTVGFRDGQEAVCHRRAEETVEEDLRVRA
ncbi:ABC transporter ATP-binding protein [Geodermatophilus chilensis]|uniref:ABC transporter ATP-binding protein n=1 Tax=Geodermatophilus chilensis TaxID=2035835 RepID=UPI000C26086B|nr:ABC transporter ATP-binding protein [Geodermatophilus chilensis]